jgi:hypothetical protein
MGADELSSAPMLLLVAPNQREVDHIAYKQADTCNICVAIAVGGCKRNRMLPLRQAGQNHAARAQVAVAARTPLQGTFTKRSVLHIIAVALKKKWRVWRDNAITGW